MEIDDGASGTLGPASCPWIKRLGVRPSIQLDAKETLKEMDDVISQLRSWQEEHQAELERVKKQHEDELQLLSSKSTPCAIQVLSDDSSDADADAADPDVETDDWEEPSSESLTQTAEGSSNGAETEAKNDTQERRNPRRTVVPRGTEHTDRTTAAVDTTGKLGYHSEAASRAAGNAREEEAKLAVRDLTQSELAMLYDASSLNFDFDFNLSSKRTEAKVEGGVKTPHLHLLNELEEEVIAEGSELSGTQTDLNLQLTTYWRDLDTVLAQLDSLPISRTLDDKSSITS
ncbi:hypothetical protein CBR_g18965 [Chara braunii]|uniref:Uncharacterized protein n=1 Tax=Chara braunii TaxID=69332 RepID=A0A388KWW6_CHABU|nr:hypothetical protein CBR_g18965 [Chara braunii]|eukprot:GBG74554.1 hypothetical protein CBR_g18965 [Chara braunii]